MITLQLPPLTTKSAHAAPPGQTTPTAPGADAAAGVTDPLFFALLLAQQAEFGTASSTGKVADTEEAATEKTEAAADPAAATPWLWLPLPPLRDAAKAKSGADQDVLTAVHGAAAGPSNDKAKAIPEQLAGLQAPADSAAQALVGEVRPAATHAQPAIPLQPQAAEVQAQRQTAVAEKITIASEIGTPRWTQDIRQNISLLVQSRTSVAELRLTPADMGPIQIRIDFSDTQPSVSISVQQADTRNALDAALPRLRDMLAESGVTLGGASVEQHSGGTGDPGRDPARLAGQPAGHAPDMAASEEPLPAARIISLDQLVDTYA